PTLNKWQLGRRLFFDPGYLDPAGGQSCAGCHVPGRGYTDKTPAHPGGFNAPTLINCLYNRRQFWDGRAVYLEEGVQGNLADDPPTSPGPSATSGTASSPGCGPTPATAKSSAGSSAVTPPRTPSAGPSPPTCAPSYPATPSTTARCRTGTAATARTWRRPTTRP